MRRPHFAGAPGVFAPASAISWRVFGLSAVLHAAVLGLALGCLFKPATFAVQAGPDSSTLHLIADASPSDPPPASAPVQTPVSPFDAWALPVLAPRLPFPVPLREMAAMKSPSAPTLPSRLPRIHSNTGNNTDAPNVGRNTVTATSNAGGRPDVLANPLPVYPETSRRQKEEGVVTLEVIISAEGRPDSISIQSSSGFKALDRSAVEAMRQWRFRPATFGGTRVRSLVIIPVCFRLDG